ncbi:MAG: 50S ribosomal protein L11 methyltransferase, partial [Spirulina sp.]
PLPITHYPLPITHYPLIMYSLFGYGNMIADRDRMNAYVKALERCIKPGSLVVDIGTGTGIFAILACQLGAQRVYAIESNPAIEVAKLAAKDNGCGDKIEFIRSLSMDVDLPQSVDVIISDLHGILPFFQQHIPAIIDARSRFLKTGGTMIPLRDRVWGTLVCAPELYRSYSSPWQDFPYNINLESARRFLLHSWQKCTITLDQCLVEPQLLTVLEYPEISTSNFQAKWVWNAKTEGLAHGLCLWFDSILMEGIALSNAPGKPDLIYGKAFLPWLEPIAIAAGDTIDCHLKANLMGEQYIWQWNCQVSTNGKIKADFQQSTFNAQLIEREALERRSLDYIPQLNEDGKIVHFILSAIDKNKNIEEIACQCIKHFPDCFSTQKNAFNRVREVIDRYNL